MYKLVNADPQVGMILIPDYKLQKVLNSGNWKVIAHIKLEKPKAPEDNRETCKICGKKFINLKSHIRVHDIKWAEYQEI